MLPPEPKLRALLPAQGPPSLCLSQLRMSSTSDRMGTWKPRP